MLSIILGCVLVALLVMYVILVERHFKLVKEHVEVYKSAKMWEETAKSWEIGIEDQAENYEQQFLSFEERIAATTAHNVTLMEELRESEELANWHREHCLPVLAHMQERALAENA